MSNRMMHMTTVEVLAAFQGQVAAAQRRASRLAKAIDQADVPSAVRATDRLCEALIEAERLADMLATDRHAYTAARHSLRVALGGAVPRLVLASQTMKEVEAVLLRFHRATDVDPALGREDSRWISGQLEGTTLLALSAAGWSLYRVRLGGATLANCHFAGSQLSEGDFRTAKIEACDFQRADLSGSTWTLARASRSTFQRAKLTDTRIDHMTFSDCDLRGVDLSVMNRGGRATAMGASFLRCDLRETNWNARWLSSVRFVDCKLHGAFGRPLVGKVDIQRPDLSPEGNGSRPGNAGDVLRSWGQ